jgi:hypothetical protein
MGLFLIITVFKNRLRKSNDLSINRFSLLIFIWILISSAPAGLKYPLEAGITIIVMTISSNLFMRTSKFAHSYLNKERRYEVTALKKILPLFILYILLLFLLPSGSDYHLLQFKSESGSHLKTFFLLRFMEQMGACTILGYLIAELRGRKTEPFSRTLLVVVLSGIVLSSPSMLIIQHGIINYTFCLGVFLILTTSLGGALIYKYHLNSIIDRSA